MKRAGLLLLLITLVIWLAQAAPAEAGIEAGKQLTASTSNTAAPAMALPQGSCCVNPGDTDPHWECFDGACVQVSGCGQSVNCATCGCSSTDEWACINNGGYWDSYSCTCDYSCDPYGTQQQSCLNQGGYWDSFNCVCNYDTGCDPTGSQRQACINSGGQWDQATCTCGETNVCVCYDEELVGYDQYDYEYCDGYYYQYCTDTYYDYYQYCEGSCGPRSWTEQVTSCYSYGEYCGGGGGGGGGGDCWDTGDCWCDDWWGICCEYDYCYEIDYYAQ